MTEPKSPPETPPGDSTGADPTDAAKLAGQKERASMEIQKDLMDAASKSLIDNLLNKLISVKHNKFGLYDGKDKMLDRSTFSVWKNLRLNEGFGSNGVDRASAPADNGTNYTWKCRVGETINSVDLVGDGQTLNPTFYQIFRPGRKFTLSDLERKDNGGKFIWSTVVENKADEAGAKTAAQAVIKDYIGLVKKAFDNSKLPADDKLDPLTGGGTLNVDDFIANLKKGDNAIITEIDQTKLSDSTTGKGEVRLKKAMDIRLSEEFNKAITNLKPHLDNLNPGRRYGRRGQQKYLIGFEVPIEDFRLGVGGVADAIYTELEKINKEHGSTQADGMTKSKNREKVYSVLRDMLIKTLTSEGEDAEDARIEALQESTRKAINAEREIQSKKGLEHPDANQKPVRAADDNWRFDPQGYLYYQISHVADFRMAQTVSSPFRGIRLAESDPNFIINFVAGARQKRMLDLKTVQAAHLIPKAKFSVIKRMPNGAVRERPIRFDTYLHKSDVNSIFYGKRGGGVGLTDVEVQFQGTDLVSVDKLFGVKAQFYIQDIERITKSNQSNHFMKLISVPFDKNEEIKLEIGWNVDDSTGNIIPAGLRHEIRKNSMTLLLGLKDHTFTVNQDGTLVLSVDYVGRLEDQLGDFKGDIFPATDNKELAKLYRAKRQIESDGFREAFREGLAVATTAGSKTPEVDESTIDRSQNKERRRAIEKIDNAKRENLRTKYKAILDNLISQGKVYQTSVDEGIIESFKDYCVIAANDGGAITRPNDGLQITPYTPPASEEEANQTTVQSNQRIVFFYMGDFIDNAVILSSQTVGSEKKLSPSKDKYDFLLGVVPTVSAGASTGQAGAIERKTYHNLAYMPITIDTYKEWFEKNITNKNKVYYPLLDFIKDVANDLVFKVLGGSYLAQTDRLRPPVSRLSINSIGINKKSPIFKKRVLKQKDFKNLHSTKANSIKDVFFLYTIPIRGSAGNLKGNRRQDAARGIHHIRMGRDRGLLKEMNFAKATIQGWRESQTLKATAQGDRSIFVAAPYNCDLKLIGNTMFKPGMTIFLDPLVTGFGSIASRNSIARRLQIGGYYIILGVTHYIKNNTFETSLRCVFNSMPNSNPEEQRQMISTEESAMFAFNTTLEENIPDANQDGSTDYLGTMSAYAKALIASSKAADKLVVQNQEFLDNQKEKKFSKGKKGKRKKK